MAKDDAVSEQTKAGPTSRELGPLLDSVRELRQALERLSATPRIDASSVTPSKPDPASASLEELTRRYEVGVWEVLMPHLIRAAPELGSETVSRLQANHQVEKELLDVLSPLESARAASASSSAAQGRLVESLEDTLKLLQTEVASAFDALPPDQRQALIEIIEHERLRAAGENPGPATQVAAAVDALETDRSTLPLPITASS